MAYTLHFELTDATLDAAWHTMANKRQAIKAAKRAAASSTLEDVRAIIICDSQERCIFTAPTGRPIKV